MSRRTLVVVLVAVAAAGVIGYAVGRSASPAPGLSPETAVGARRETPPRPGIPPSEDPATIAALAVGPEPVVESGDLSITGWVTSVDGLPIAGVKITTHRVWHRPREQWGQDLPLEEQIRNLIARHNSDRSTRREATTAADGTYRLTGLTDGEHRVSAEHEGYVFGEIRVSSGRTADFRGRPVAALEFTFVFPDGTLPDSVKVTATGPHRGTTGWTLSPERARMTLAPGPWTLIARTLDRTLFSREYEVRLEAGVPATRLTLTLADRPGIRGRVRFEEAGGHINAAVVLLGPAGPGDSGDEGVPLARTGVSNLGFGGREMDYAFPNLEPGPYRVRVEWRGRKHPPVVVEAGSRMAEQDLVVGAVPPETVVLVRVLGPDGKEDHSARLHAGYRSRTRSRQSSQRPDRAPDGRWRLAHAEVPEGGERGDLEFFVHVESTEYGRRTVSYVPGEDREITVRFKEPARLRVTVSGYAGSGIEGEVRVGLSRADGVRPSYAVPVDAAGAAAFPPVEPGPYLIRYLVRTEDRRTRSGLSVPVELSAGERTASLSLPPLASLRED